MAEVQQGRFACTSCGKTYRWKPELAGKQAKCKCGSVMQVPMEAPAAPEDDLYALADDGPPKRTQPSAASAASAASSIAMPAMGIPVARDVVVPPADPARAPGPVLPYGGGKRTVAEKRGDYDLETAVGGELWREMYLPIGLLVLGFAMQIGMIMYAGGGNWRSLSTAVPMIAARLAINLVLSFTGIIIVAKLMEVSFGAVGPAVIKIAAICLLVPAISYTIGAIVGADSPFVHMMIASMLTFPLGCIGFKLLFDIDFVDVIYCVVIISLVNDWVMFFLMGMMFSTGIGGEL